MKTWLKVNAENLVRHFRGTYYLRAKVRGEKIFESLKTSSLKVAKIKREARLEELRQSLPGTLENIETLGDAINLAVEREVANPRTKPRTKASHRETAAAVKKTLNASLAGKAWTKDDAVQWWRAHTAKHAASQANKALSLVKRSAEILIEAGVRHDNPAKGLKRVREKASAVDELPPRRSVLKVIASIRRQRKRESEQAAQMVAFLLWSGLRKGELQALQWEDIGTDWLTVRDGKSGRRRVPISASLRKLIGKMRAARADGASGPVFTIKDPRGALGAACRRLGIPHLRVHDLRHLFATRAIEAGVDVPTVAKWLGHKDGGALAMRTYGHIRDDHSLAQVAKLG